MTFEEIRLKHPRMIYEQFNIKRNFDSIEITFIFRLEPDIIFKPHLTIICPAAIKNYNLENLVFHLGLIELVSYWKVACPEEVYIKPGFLNKEQREWWKNLYIKGLSEFFFTNKIDFTQPDFLKLICGKKEKLSPALVPGLKGELILVGGGKDSVVALELVQAVKERHNVLLLNPTPAALNISKQAGYGQPIIIKRNIDEQLFILNKQGYLNGHTPFSAYLAFLGLLIAYIHKFSTVVVANEWSANEANINYKHRLINHQYSKSFEFEEKFRKYSKKYLSSGINYYSITRPINELQIGKIISQSDQYLNKFISCNKNKGYSWCGKCPKCVFSFIILFPFLKEDKIINIFGRNYFKDDNLPWINELAGFSGHKPFDCVGTKQEVRAALILATKKYLENNYELPKILKQMDFRISKIQNKVKLVNSILKFWNPDHHLPQKYEIRLKKLLQNL